MTEPEQKWGVWNVNLCEWAFAPIPSGEARAREVAARFERESFEGKHVGPVCKYEARRVGATAPDLLSELSAADHLRSSWALAELCKRAGERIRADADAAQTNNEYAARQIEIHGRQIAEAVSEIERLRAELGLARDLENELESALDATRAASKPAASRRRIADACDALLAALDHTRPHTKEDHPGIVRAIDGLVVARIADYANGYVTGESLTECLGRMAGEGEKKT